MLVFFWYALYTCNYSSFQCKTDEIHACCFKANGALLATGPVETDETEIRIY